MLQRLTRARQRPAHHRADSGGVESARLSRTVYNSDTTNISGMQSQRLGNTARDEAVAADGPRHMWCERLTQSATAFLALAVLLFLDGRIGPQSFELRRAAAVSVLVGIAATRVTRGTTGTETGTRSVCPGAWGRKPGRDQLAQEPEQQVALNSNRVLVSVPRRKLRHPLFALPVFFL